MNPAILRAIRWLRALARAEDRRWLDAMAAEIPQAGSFRERLAWAVGAHAILAVSLARRLQPHAWLILLTIVAGAAMIYADLRIESRSPYFALLIGYVAVAAFLRPASPWPLILAVLAAFCLPAGIMFGFEAGVYDRDLTYAHESGNTTFPLIPAVPVALAAGWLQQWIRRGKAA